MTTIVYRDGVLAADSQTTCGVTGMRLGRVRKIGQAADGAMWGLAGNGCHAAAWQGWVESPRDTDPPDFPTGGGDRQDVSLGVLVEPDGTLREWFGGMGWHACEPQPPFYAAGSGAGLAIGAMAMGASAEEAVRVAIEYDTGSGGEVLVLRLPR